MLRIQHHLLQVDRVCRVIQRYVIGLILILLYNDLLQLVQRNQLRSSSYAADTNNYRYMPLSSVSSSVSVSLQQRHNAVNEIQSPSHYNWLLMLNFNIFNALTCRHHCTCTFNSTVSFLWMLHLTGMLCRLPFGLHLHWLLLAELRFKFQL